ncbi:MAG: hypothetical protein H6735_22855 [Alphaproteobacteria bacterium]|nr:hypothetical protein [Alphaproteobacteria bacterium]
MPRISPWPAVVFFVLLAGFAWLARAPSTGPTSPALQPSMPAVSNDLGSDDLDRVNEQMRKEVEALQGRSGQ